MIRKNIKKRGFTLIELMIVMIVIAILAGLSLFSMQGARRQGRDGKRKSDLEVIRSAIELFKADCNTYPANGCVTAGATLTGSAACGCNPAQPGNTYIQKIPSDPTSTNTYSYVRGGGGATYTLCSTLEDPPSPPNNTSGCGGCGATCGWKVTNP